MRKKFSGIFYFVAFYFVTKSSDCLKKMNKPILQAWLHKITGKDSSSWFSAKIHKNKFSATSWKSVCLHYISEVRL